VSLRLSFDAAKAAEHKIDAERMRITDIPLFRKNGARMLAFAIERKACDPCINSETDLLSIDIRI
jgi:hypothetical protein